MSEKLKPFEEMDLEEQKEYYLKFLITLDYLNAVTKAEDVRYGTMDFLELFSMNSFEIAKKYTLPSFVTFDVANNVFPDIIDDFLQNIHGKYFYDKIQIDIILNNITLTEEQLDWFIKTSSYIKNNKEEYLKMYHSFMDDYRAGKFSEEYGLKSDYPIGLGDVAENILEAKDILDTATGKKGISFGDFAKTLGEFMMGIGENPQKDIYDFFTIPDEIFNFEAPQKPAHPSEDYIYNESLIGIESEPYNEYAETQGPSAPSEDYENIPPLKTKQYFQIFDDIYPCDFIGPKPISRLKQTTALKPISTGLGEKSKAFFNAFYIPDPYEKLYSAADFFRSGDAKWLSTGTNQVKIPSLNAFSDSIGKKIQNNIVKNDLSVGDLKNAFSDYKNNELTPLLNEKLYKKDVINLFAEKLESEIMINLPSNQKHIIE